MRSYVRIYQRKFAPFQLHHPGSGVCWRTSRTTMERRNINAEHRKWWWRGCRSISRLMNVLRFVVLIGTQSESLLTPCSRHSLSPQYAPPHATKTAPTSLIFMSIWPPEKVNDRSYNHLYEELNYNVNFN